MRNKKRCIIVKVDSIRFVKYRWVNNLPLFVEFLNKQYPDWRWGNVYDKDTKLQVGNFTKFKRPAKHI